MTAGQWIRSLLNQRYNACSGEWGRGREYAMKKAVQIRSEGGRKGAANDASGRTIGQKWRKTRIPPHQEVVGEQVKNSSDRKESWSNKRNLVGFAGAEVNYSGELVRVRYFSIWCLSGKERKLPSRGNYSDQLVWTVWSGSKGKKKDKKKFQMNSLEYWQDHG